MKFNTLIIILFLASGLLLVSPTLAHAEDEGTEVQSTTSIQSSNGNTETHVNVNVRQNGIKTFMEDRKIEMQGSKEGEMQRKEEIKTNIQQLIEKRCASLSAQITTRVNKFDDTKDKHITEYQNMKDRIQKFITKISSMGYDTSTVQSDLATLDTKIKQFSTDYATYITDLKSTKTYACGNSDGQFKSTISTAKQDLVKVHTDAAAIRSYYETVIRPDLLALKKQHTQNEATSSANDK